MKEKLGSGFLLKFIISLVTILSVASVTMSTAVFTTVFGVSAQADMTQTQKGVNSFLSDILKDKTLTDNEKAMFVEIMRTYSADCITSMDDARLFISRFIESGVLTPDKEELLSSLLECMDNGEISDLGMVKAILSNVLLGVKGDIIGEKSPTFNKIEELVAQIDEDKNLSDAQKDMYKDILWGILSEDFEIMGVNDNDSVKGLINILMDNNMITDPSTEQTLSNISGDINEGKKFNMDLIKEVFKYTFKQMLGDDTYSGSQKELLADLKSKNTNLDEPFAGFNTVDDAKPFLTKIIVSELVQDAHVVRDMNDIVDSISSGNTPELTVINTVIKNALDDIKNTLLIEKISAATGTNVPEGINASEYYEKLIARYTSSQFNYLETISLANQEEINKLIEGIDQNMILSEHDREEMIKMLSTYQTGSGETMNDTAEALQKAIDNNSDMDAKTKASLITMINSVENKDDASVSELKVKLGEKIDDLEGDNKDLQNELKRILLDLEDADADNKQQLKNDIKKLEKNDNKKFDDVSIDIASVRKELAESNHSQDLTTAALRSDLTALDKKTANQIKELVEKNTADAGDLEDRMNDRMDNMEANTAEAISNLSDDTDTRLNDLSNATNERIDNLETTTNNKIDTLETDTNDKIDTLESNTNNKIDTLETNTNNKIDALETETNNKIDTLTQDTEDHFDTLETDIDNRFSAMETDTDAKIQALRTETQTALALLEADIDAVEASVVETNANMALMNENLIARDETMKAAIDASLQTSFANIEAVITSFINNTESNFAGVKTEMENQYTQNETNYNNVVNNLGMQMTYTLDTTGTEPVLTFTPYGTGYGTNGWAEYNGTAPNVTITETDAPTNTYTAPDYSEP